MIDVFGFNWWYIEGAFISFSILASVILNFSIDNEINDWDWQPYGIITYIIIHAVTIIAYLMAKGIGYL